MIVDKQEFVRVFSSLMPWSNDNKSWMRVDKQELVQESFLNSHVLVKREQELHED